MTLEEKVEFALGGFQPGDVVNNSHMERLLFNPFTLIQYSLYMNGWKAIDCFGTGGYLLSEHYLTLVQRPTK